MLSEGGSQDGFTLVELLVAMAASVGIMIALTTLMITVLDQTGVTYARISATRGTRLALTEIENELHSACVGSGTTQSLPPLQAGSDGSTLSFLAYTGTSDTFNGSAANPNPVWHTLTVTAAGTLTDASYATTGTPGNWTRASQPTSTKLMLTNVTQQLNSQGSAIPYFQYFAYKPLQATGDAAGDWYWVIPDGTNSLPNGTTPISSPLSIPLGVNAAKAVEVLITFAGGPQETGAGNGVTNGTADPVTDSISLRLTTPPDEAPTTSAGSYGPCQ